MIWVLRLNLDQTIQKSRSGSATLVTWFNVRKSTSHFIVVDDVSVPAYLLCILNQYTTIKVSRYNKYIFFYYSLNFKSWSR